MCNYKHIFLMNKLKYEKELIINYVKFLNNKLN